MLFVINDNSASVLLSKDSSFFKGEYLVKLNAFSNQLADNFEVVNYDLAGELNPGFSGLYDGKSTDLSVAFNSIFDQYTNRNIGGIVLATDGIYNTGANPLYAIARRSFLPIFTIGLGDTNLVKDVRIDAVNHNDLAFLGNDFPIEVSISQTICKGETVSVGIYDGDQLIKQEKVTFSADENQLKFQFIAKANRIGFRKYRAEVSRINGEYTIKNNEANFYVEVIDGRQKILLTYQAPHPDVAALRGVIEKNKNYEVDVKFIKDIDKLTGYDLVIVHNYSTENQLLNDYIKNGTGPLFFLVGLQADFDALSDLQIGFKGRRTAVEDVIFAANSNYKEILIGSTTKNVLSNAPPIQAPFGSINFSEAIEILAYQKVGNITLEQPLIYFTQKQESRLGVLMGEGIWRWRLYDQMKNQNTANFNDFFGKIITYLAVKENKDPFRVQMENEFTENDPVVVRAELYNKSFDLINEPEVKFVYKNENEEEFESYFVKTSDAYQLDLGKLKQGIYSWTASTVFQDKNYSKSGTFLVREVKIEFLNSVADHRILRTIAENSGGQFFFSNQFDELSSHIRNRDDMVTVVYQEKEYDDLIDYKWLFVIIVLLFAVEWFVRKFQGAY